MFKLPNHSYLLLVLCINFVTCKHLNHVTTLQRQIIDSRPYQATVFTRNSVRNYFFKELTSNVPAVIVDLTKNLNQSLIPPNINLTRKSNLLVLIQDQLDFEDVKSNLELFIKLSPIKIRPKCLVIFNYTTSNHNLIRSVLLYGWSKKFLDLTVINLNNGEVFNYNPFSNVFGHNQAKSADIFPIKLKNMNGY